MKAELDTVKSQDKFYENEPRSVQRSPQRNERLCLNP